MIACEIIRDVGPDGRVCFDLPDFIGKKVKIICTSIFETQVKIADMDTDMEFTAAAYLAGIDDDETEDVIWEKYIDPCRCPNR
jgi:hypothetical protein